MKKTLFFTLVSMLLCTSMQAQKKNIMLHYDFNQVEGTTVKDVGRLQADAKLMNGAKVENGLLLLGSTDAYLDMTEQVGEAISKMRDFTISATYMVDNAEQIQGNGYFLWCFSQMEANKEKEGCYHAYRINQQRVETSIGGYTQETGIQKGEASEKGKWVTVVYRQQAGKGELFVNGEFVGIQNAFPEFNRIFRTSPKCNWIGRAPFAGDNYLRNTKVSDFRIYNIAISNNELRELLSDMTFRPQTLENLQ